MKQKVFIWLRIFFTTVCLLISVFFLWAALPLPVEQRLDPEYALLTAKDEVITQSYAVSECDTVLFCYADLSQSKRTLFSNAVPNIRIVNDGENYVELTANRSVHEAVSIRANEKTLIVDFHDEFYNAVYVDDTEYDYDFGLYVDCTAFDITIHGNIRSFMTNTQTVLDFQVAPADRVYLDFSFEGTSANIHDIAANELTLYCSGDSEIILSGSVKGEADMNIWHNTKVDATQLEAGRHDTEISSQIFGWSYIKLPAHPMVNPFGIGTVITVILVTAPLFWLNRDIRLFRKLRSAKND